jgi:DNA-binding MarR family transcriptional regulator
MADRKPTYPLREDVHWLMARLARSLGVVEADAVEPYGITLREFVVLAEVDVEGGRSQLAVARAAAVDRSLMVTVVDSLESKGFLERSQHPTDRRVRTLEITAQGQEVLAKAAVAVREREDRLLASLSAKRQADLRAILGALAATAADAGFDVTPCV